MHPGPWRRQRDLREFFSSLLMTSYRKNFRRFFVSQNKALYDKMGLKSIFQGGEKHSLTGHSFVAQAN